MDTKERPIEEKISKPAGRWRNRWLAHRAGFGARTGVPFAPGEVYWSQFFWPSKEIAEQKAIEDQKMFPGVCSYLGAFPEGQDAP